MPAAKKTAILSTDWAGKECKLVFAQSKESVYLDTRVDIGRDGKREIVKVLGGRAPHKPESTGRVLVSCRGATFGQTEYFPSVVGARWVRI